MLDTLTLCIYLIHNLLRWDIIPIFQLGELRLSKWGEEQRWNVLLRIIRIITWSFLCKVLSIVPDTRKCAIYDTYKKVWLYFSSLNFFFAVKFNIEKWTKVSRLIIYHKMSTCRTIPELKKCGNVFNTSEVPPNHYLSSPLKILFPWLLWKSLLYYICTFPGGSVVKNPPAMHETWVRSLGQEDPLEKGMATHSNILAWRISWTEEPGGLQFMGSQRVEHDCTYNQVISTHS